MTSKRLAVILRELTPTEFSDNVLLMWISNCENTILTDVMLVSEEDCVELTEMSDAPLTVPHPWDKLYLPYMQAQVAHANGEYDHYANYIALYNAYLEEYTRHIIETVNPSGGRAVRDAYYLSAYAIAVEHGFVGTVEEWLASLIGKQGEKGDPGEKGEPGEKGDPGEVTEEQAKKIAEEAAGKAMTAAESAVTAAEDAKSTAESAKAIAQPCVVNMTKKADGTYTADKQFAELKAAHDAGRTVICSFQDLSIQSSAPCRLPLMYLSNTYMGFAAVVTLEQDYMAYVWAYINNGGMGHTATEIAAMDTVSAMIAAAIGNTATALSDMDSVIGGAEA